MSTGKRLAKRSIIGTRVCARIEDGMYYSGVIQAVTTPAAHITDTSASANNSINLTPFTRYTVRFDPRQGTVGRTALEFYAADLIGPGFKPVADIHLLAGQRVYLTFNGREVNGEVQSHSLERDELIVRICPQGIDRPFEVQKRLEEIRLLESRKSARLADQDTDFARLADMAGGDRKRNASHTIDVPVATTAIYGSRKRRPSNSTDDFSPYKDSQMDECNAALVLMSLSCSPSSRSAFSWTSTSPSSSSSASSRYTPSPPPRDSSSPTGPLSPNVYDEGIEMDYFDELPRKKKSLTAIIYQCTWKSCIYSTESCANIEEHVRNEHLLANGCEVAEGEEDFYYNELEVGKTSPAPTLSHRDMARPPHEDPEYQRQLVGNYRQQRLAINNNNTSNNIISYNHQNINNSGPISIPVVPQVYSVQHVSVSAQMPAQLHYHHPQSPHKVLKLSPPSQSPLSPKQVPVSPRRVRGENKKCRKVYGMEHREQWCTQCKWKKACTRFGD